MIDLRSDSSSTPTDAMRKAMATAAVGNDAFGEDPTLNELERRAASLLGKESALFVSSGTMGNLLAILAATDPGDAVLAGRLSHLVRFEAGSAARFGGVSLVTFADSRGRMKIEELESFLTLPMSLRPRMLSVENTHNSSGGLVLSVKEMAQYASLARQYGLHLHLDGARIFNAAFALGVSVSELSCRVDSVSFCLTKCLSAPAGALLGGSEEFITRAREWRFQLGGQMRQIGILAAAGLMALDSMLPQIEKDHLNARILAQGLGAIDGIEVDTDLVETNIVLFDVSNLVDSAQEFEERLEAHSVYASVFSPRHIRFITYRDIQQGEIDEVLEITREVAQECRV